jgi:hypothetical protein
MTHLYFHCRTADEIILDRRGAEVRDLKDARERAVGLVQGMMAQALGVASFRDWHIHVADEEDEEVLSVPFATVLARLH